MDYEKYVGTRIYDQAMGRELLIAGLDPEVGVTLVNPDDPDDIHRCLVHPQLLAKKYKVPEDRVHGSDETFRRSFEHYVEGIMAGRLTEQWNTEHKSFSKANTSSFPVYADPTELCAFR